MSKGKVKELSASKIKKFGLPFNAAAAGRARMSEAEHTDAITKFGPFIGIQDSSISDAVNNFCIILPLIKKYVEELALENGAVISCDFVIKVPILNGTSQK